MRSLFLIIVLLFPAIANSEPLSLNEIGESVCRVGAGSAYGSGTAIHNDGTYVYVLTNAHVTGSSRTVNLEFFRWGRKSSKLQAEVIWTAGPNEQVDFALCKLKADAFGSLPPRIMPMAPAGYKPSSGDYLSSGGHPQARWLQLWEGFTKETDQSGHIVFSPSPLGGQSGSGLHTVIDGETRMVGIITWRSDGSGLELDANGYDTASGRAISMNSLRSALAGNTSLAPENPRLLSPWKHVSDYEDDGFRAVEEERLFALGSDGVYYQQKGHKDSPFANVPPGVKIRLWNIRWPDRSAPPGGGRPSPDGGGSSPFGSIPPNLLDDPSPNPNPGTSPNEPNPETHKECEDRIAELELQLADLQARYDALFLNTDILSKEAIARKAQLEALSKDLEAIKKSGLASDTRIKSLEGQLKKKQKELELILSDLSSAKNEMSVFQDILDSKNRALLDINGKLGNLNDEKEGLEGSLSDTKDQAVGLIQQRNIFGGLGGGSVIFGVLYWWFKVRGKEKLNNVIDSVQGGLRGKIDSGTDSIVDRLHSRIDDIENNLTGSKDNQTIENIQDSIDAKLQDHADALYSNIGNLIDSIQNKLIDKVDDGLKERKPLQRRPVKKNEVTTNINITNPGLFNEEVYKIPVGQRAKDLCDLKEHQGEDLKKWAFYALLYKEAVQRLREGKFILQTRRSNNKLQGQDLTAEKVTMYVEREFIKRFQQVDINLDYRVHEATIGFLYSEAVDMLRQGHFNVLGAVETADAIDRWVNREFMKRMGVKL